jgi:hypothetical protein
MEATWDRAVGETGKRTFAMVRLRRGARECGLRGPVPEREEPVLPRRRRGADADARLGGRVDVRAERVRRRGAQHGRCCGSRQLCATAPPAPGGQGWRPQLSRHFECGRFADVVDASHARSSAARGIPATGLCRRGRADARRDPGRRLAMGACVRRGHHPRRRLCAGRGLHDGRRCRLSAERRLRQFLQGVRPGVRGPAGGRGRHRRRRDPHYERL